MFTAFHIFIPLVIFRLLSYSKFYVQYLAATCHISISLEPVLLIHLLLHPDLYQPPQISLSIYLFVSFVITLLKMLEFYYLLQFPLVHVCHFPYFHTTGITGNISFNFLLFILRPTSCCHL